MTKSIVCAAHGPECQDERHPVITLGLWRAGQGLCGECGQPGSIPWGNPTRTHVLRCQRCALIAQIAHAKERAVALPALEAELRELEEVGQ